MLNNLVFDRQEFFTRLQSTVSQLEQRNLDVALIFSPANQYYLTGYNSESAYMPQVVIVSTDASQPKLIVRAMDAFTVTATSWLDSASVIGIPENYIGVRDKDGFDFICEQLMALGLASKRIGIELGAGLTAGAWTKIKSRLPDTSFMDITGMVTWQRMVKSPAEITYMRQAAAISDAAMKATVDTIGSGVRQRDAGAALVAALIRGTDEFGGDRVRHPNMPAGDRIKAPHLAWNDGVYNLGDPVNIELAASRHRYCAGLSRSLSIGEPSKAFKDLHEAVVEGMEKALEQVRPGNACGATFDAFQSVIAPRGYKKSSRIGYSHGIDWIEATASLQHGDTTLFVPNMTIHMICGMWEEEKIGYVLSETFLVTETGAERLSKTPRELFVKE